MYRMIAGRLVGVPLMSPDGGTGGGATGSTGEGAGASTGQSGAADGSESGSGTGGTDSEIPKTKEELQKLLQSEADKRVTSALKTAQEKWELEYKQKLEAEKAEAEKLAKMSAAEKEQALLEKQKKDIADRERAIQQKELKLETIKILNDKKLPIDFADLLLADDADKTKGNVDTFEKAFRDAVEKAVVERLKGSTPGSGGATAKAGEYGKKVAEAFSQKNDELEKARKSYFG
ncbi:DUF4355 domain-containing protein [Bacillus sp. FJAT-49736]|uniref:DUF4355 domain-containing protein n=1 Tax=Bacillus sp. FJAT-49736 TaxID=2833582 RepID=UPI001BC8D2A3|nr:DUF4355 domain-containing protein [Bacillus sp. FJAT-49736]MBS4172114.1 DUF4355 domain-containing protein [Bacillus sp. FJAT-49736]